MEEIIGKTSAELSTIRTGSKARIIRINTQDNLKLRKLAAFGILPGNDIIILQKYPAFVIQIGFTQVALDEEIASKIVVSLI